MMQPAVLAEMSMQQIKIINDEANNSEEAFNNKVMEIIEKEKKAKLEKQQQEENLKRELEIKNNEAKMLQVTKSELVKQLNEIEEKLENALIDNISTGKKIDKYKKVILSLSITLGITIGFLFFFIFYPKPWDFLKIIFAGVLSLGGLWSFIRLILAIISFFKKK